MNRSLLILFLFALRLLAADIQPAKLALAPVPSFSTNLGVATTISTTNATAPTFEAQGCMIPGCTRTHHYRVVEHYRVETRTVIPVRVDGRLQFLPHGETKTNFHGLYTTNYVEHPAVWQRQSMLPLPDPILPPEPDQIYWSARAKNAAALQARTNAVLRREIKENRPKIIPP